MLFKGQENWEKGKEIDQKWKKKTEQRLIQYCSICDTGIDPLISVTMKL